MIKQIKKSLLALHPDYVIQNADADDYFILYFHKKGEPMNSGFVQAIVKSVNNYEERCYKNLLEFVVNSLVK